MAVPRSLRRSVARHGRTSLLVPVAIGGTLLAACVAVLFVALWSANGQHADAAADSRRSVRVVGHVDELQRQAIELETSVRAHALTGDPAFASASRVARDQIPRTLDALDALVADTPAEARNAARLRALVDRYVAATLPLKQSRAADLRRLGPAAFAVQGTRRMGALRDRFDQFRSTAARLAAEREAASAAAARRDTRVAFLAVTGAATGIAALIAFLVLVVVRPVRRVTRAVDAVARGEREVDAGVRGRSEVAHLAAGIGALARTLGEQERHEAEAAAALLASERTARANQELFRIGFEHAPTGMTAGTPDGGFIQVNARMCELTGYAADELVQDGAALIWAGDTGTAVRQDLAALWSGATSRLDREGPFRHASGEEVWLSSSAACVRDADGRPLFILAQFQDITARRRAETREQDTAAALRLSQARYQAVVDSIDEVVFQCSLTGRWRFLSPAFTRLTGIRVEDALGQSALDLVHPDDQDVQAEAFAQLMVSGESRLAFEHRYPRRCGQPGWMAVEAHVTSDPETGAPLISGLMRDVTELRAAEQAAREHLESLTAVSEVARMLPTGGDARAAICAAAVQVSGATHAVLFEPEGGRLVSTGMANVDAEVFTMELDQRSGTTTAFRTGEQVFIADAVDNPAVSQSAREALGFRSAVFQPVRHDGDSVAVLAIGWAEPVSSLSDQHAAVIGLLAAEAAVAIERSDLLGRLESMARTDALTGLPNRRVWGEQIASELSRSQRHEYPVCVALLDLDHFKRVNDTLGHAGGDELLAATGVAWRGVLRDVDLLARWGGEEFAVALPACDLDDALEVVGRLRAAVPGDHTTSAGVALWDGMESADALLGRADAALYRAKANGRDRAEAAPARPRAPIT